MSNNQQLYNELFQFLLETVSSEEYLTSLDIHRPAYVNWETFKKQVFKQTIKPGIYPALLAVGRVFTTMLFAVTRRVTGRSPMGTPAPVV